jgi:hypothetical protein
MFPLSEVLRELSPGCVSSSLPLSQFKERGRGWPIPAVGKGAPSASILVPLVAQDHMVQSSLCH